MQVVLVGASVRSMAESALRDGLDPICIDMFADADLRLLLQRQHGSADGWLHRMASFADLPDLLQRVPHGIPVVFSGGLENHLDVLTAIAERHPVAGTSCDVIAEVTNPETMSRRLMEQGIELPRWSTTGGGSLGIEWLRKSRTSSGGLGISEVGVLRSDDGSQCHSRSDFFQEKIQGIPASATFLTPQWGENTSADPELLGVALQLSGVTDLNAPPYFFCGNAGPLHVNSTLHERLGQVGRAVGRLWRMEGVFGVDFIVRDGIPLVLEINPRITASHDLHEMSSYGQPGHVSMQLSTVLDRASETAIAGDRCRGYGAAGPSSGRHAVRFVVYSSHDTLVTETQRAALLNLSAGNGTFRIADVPSDGGMIEAASPVCSIYMGLEGPEGGPEGDASLLYDAVGPFLSDPVIRLRSALKSIQDQINILEADFDFDRY